MRHYFCFLIALLLVLPLAAPAQNSQAAGGDKFNQAANSIQQKLEASIAELNALREQAAQETIPLSRQLSELESELVEVRREFQNTTRLLDTRTLDLTNLRNQIESRKGEATYLSNLLSEYIRKFETRLHIAEIDLYEEKIDAAKLAMENENLSEQEVFEAQAALLLTALERLESSLGGKRFDGSAVGPDGLLTEGTFLLVGPSALFASKDGNVVGTAEQRLGSLEASVLAFNNPEDAQAAADIIAGRGTTFPFDPTLGNAHKVEETEESFAEHVQKGGPVMVPIFALAGAAVLVALFKWMQFISISTPSRKRVRNLLGAVAKHDEKEMHHLAEAIAKPNWLTARGFGFGAIVGVSFGALVSWLLHQDFAAPYAEQFPMLVDLFNAMIFCGIAGGIFGFLFRLLLGYSPVGEMLAVGIEHVREPHELIEEVMYEKVLATRLRLERFLPFVAISAASAPLLGLLGTVTGIINTFKLITVFGSGDVKTLSSGISEALVTTEFGLIVAIPSLLLHAFLARRARSVINDMEQAAVALLNAISKHPFADTHLLKGDMEPVASPFAPESASTSGPYAKQEGGGSAEEGEPDGVALAAVQAEPESKDRPPSGQPEP